MFSEAFTGLAKSQVLRIIEAAKTSKGVSVSALSEELGLSYMGVKKHCVTLEKLGYLKASRVPREKVGRPMKFYTVTEKCDPLFPDQGSEILLSILDGVKEFFSDQAPEKLFYYHFEQLKKQWASSINNSQSLVEKATQLADLRAKSGYFNRCKYDPQQGFWIEEYHHPMKKIFSLYPSLITLEVRMMEQLLGSKVIRKETQLQGNNKLVTYQINTLA